METQSTPTHFQQWWNKKSTIFIVSLCLSFLIGLLFSLSIRTIGLKSENDQLLSDLDEAEYYVQLSKEQGNHIITLEDHIDTLEQSVVVLEDSLSSLEMELTKLEDNLTILSDVKSKIHQ